MNNIKNKFIDKLINLSPTFNGEMVLKMLNDNEMVALTQTGWAKSDDTTFEGDEYDYVHFLEFDTTNRIANINYDVLNEFVSLPRQRKITAVILDYMTQSANVYLNNPVKKLVLKQVVKNDSLFENELYMTAENVSENDSFNMTFATAKKGELPKNAAFDINDKQSLLDANSYTRDYELPEYNHADPANAKAVFVTETKMICE